jgi:hypothetical protein
MNPGSMPPRNVFVHRSVIGRPGATRRGAASKISRDFPRRCLPAPCVYIFMCKAFFEYTLAIGAGSDTDLLGVAFQSGSRDSAVPSCIREIFVFRAIRIKLDTRYVERRQSFLLKAPEAWQRSLSSFVRDLDARVYSILLGPRAVSSS